LTPANDILFWDQVIEADQFFLFALWPLIRWLSGGRIFFCSSVDSFQLFLNQSLCQVAPWPNETKLVHALVVHG